MMDIPHPHSHSFSYLQGNHINSLDSDTFSGLSSLSELNFILSPLSPLFISLLLSMRTVSNHFLQTSLITSQVSILFNSPSASHSLQSLHFILSLQQLSHTTPSIPLLPSLKTHSLVSLSFLLIMIIHLSHQHPCFTIPFHPSLIPSSSISQISKLFIIITTLSPHQLIFMTSAPTPFHPSSHTLSPLSLNSHSFPSFPSHSPSNSFISHSILIQITFPHSPLISLLSQTSNIFSFPSINSWNYLISVP